MDARYVGTDPRYRTPLAFAILDPPEEPDILFYRAPHGPDESIAVEDVDLETVETVPIFWVAGSRVAFEPSRTTVTELLRLRGRSTSGPSQARPFGTEKTTFSCLPRVSTTSN